MSLYFLDANNQKLVHGAEICGEYLEDEGMAKEIAVDKNTARELFTIEFIIEAINAVFRNCCENLVDQLVKMIVFDAIVGNNDRHFYNWGVITDVRKSESARPIFSPIYDSARGLLWNWSDERVKKSLKNLEKGNKNVENYIEKASPRISIEGNSEVNHFGLIKYVFKKYNNSRGTILDLISLKNEDAVVRMYNAEFKQHFIRERNELILHILRERFKRLREITAI